MRRIHNGLTITALVEPTQLPKLRQLLRQIQEQYVMGDVRLDFRSMPSLLFASMTIADATQDAAGQPLPTRLLIFTSYAGSKRQHLAELIKYGADGLRAIFAHCIDFSETATSPRALHKYVQEHLIHNTYYTGSHFVTRADRSKEYELYQGVQAFLDEKQQDANFQSQAPTKVYQQIRDYLHQQPTLAWALQSDRRHWRDWLGLFGPLVLVFAVLLPSLLAPLLGMLWRGPVVGIWTVLAVPVALHLVWPLLRRVLRPANTYDKVAPKGKRISLKAWLIRLVVLLILMGSLVAMTWQLIRPFTNWAWLGTIWWGFVLFVLTLLFLLRQDEKVPSPKVEPLEDQAIREITVRESYPVVNEMTVISTIKPGRIRRFFLAFTLRLVPFFRAFSHIPTVHTARWLQTDEGRRIVFVAYFDNTSEGYAHDFVDSTKRTRNLNLIFGHALGFPTTRFAVLEGGKDRRQYMLGVRKAQVLTAVWYNSHPYLSISNVVRNHAIRKGLAKSIKGEELTEWLALL